MTTDELTRQPGEPPSHSPGHSPGRPSLATPGGRPGRTVAITGGLAAYSWIAADAAPFSAAALWSVLLPGAVIGAIAYGRPPERIPAPERVDVTGFSYWLICVAALFEWEAAAFRDGSPWWHPTLTKLIDPMLSWHPAKSAAIGVWLLAGWALARR